MSKYLRMFQPTLSMIPESSMNQVSISDHSKLRCVVQLCTVRLSNFLHLQECLTMNASVVPLGTIGYDLSGREDGGTWRNMAKQNARCFDVMLLKF